MNQFMKLQNILFALQSLVEETKKADSKYYCTTAAMKLSLAADMIKEAVEEMKK